MLRKILFIAVTGYFGSSFPAVAQVDPTETIQPTRPNSPLPQELPRSTNLSVAVFDVMQQQPEQVLEITAILDAIFVAETPKDVRSTARERVSNVLSVGAKKGKWYRGKLGKYSMSKAAVEDSAT